MNAVRRFGAFCYDFVVGDDWRIALGVVIGLAITAAIAHGARFSAWWLLPVIVIGMLAVSLWTATRRR